MTEWRPEPMPTLDGICDVESRQFVRPGRCEEKAEFRQLLSPARRGGFYCHNAAPRQPDSPIRPIPRMIDVRVFNDGISCTHKEPAVEFTDYVVHGAPSAGNRGVGTINLFVSIAIIHRRVEV